MGWIVPALQTATALVGAKASSDAAKASQRGTDLKKLRKEAEAAGFNPLTVLRATGGQGFNKGSSGALASAAFWSSFANSAGEIAEQFDPYRQEMRRLDMAQAEASLANTKASTKAMGVKAPLQSFGPGGVEIKYIPGTNVEVGTNLLKIPLKDLVTIPAEYFEQEYGEIGAEVFGFVRMGMDLNKAIAAANAIRRDAQQNLSGRNNPRTTPRKAPILQKELEPNSVGGLRGDRRRNREYVQ
jgi:hypothetical protein